MPYAVDVFPDAELVTIVAITAPLQEIFSGLRVVTILPAEIKNPVVRVKRTSGAQRDIVLDRPVIDADTFWTDYGMAGAISRQVTAELLSARGRQLSNGVITNVNVVQGSRWLPDPNPSLYRFSASYEVFMHAHTVH